MERRRVDGHLEGRSPGGSVTWRVGHLEGCQALPRDWPPPPRSVLVAPPFFSAKKNEEEKGRSPGGLQGAPRAGWTDGRVGRGARCTTQPNDRCPARPRPSGHGPQRQRQAQRDRERLRVDPSPGVCRSGGPPSLCGRTPTNIRSMHRGGCFPLYGAGGWPPLHTPTWRPAPPRRRRSSGRSWRARTRRSSSRRAGQSTAPAPASPGRGPAPPPWR